MPDKQLTPIQKALSKFDRLTGNDLRDTVIRDVVNELKALLPTEKQFACDVWQAASEYTESAGWTQIEEKEPPPNFKNFYKQYEQ